MGMRIHQRTVMNFRRPACTRVVWSLLCLQCQRSLSASPSRRFEWSSQYHARFRVTSHSRLPRRCFVLDEFDASVLTGTLCNESKWKRISVPSLDQRPLKLRKNSKKQPTEPSKHLRYHLGSLLTSTGDRRFRADNAEAKILTAELDKHAWPPAMLHPWDCTSRRWLLRQLPQKHRPRTGRLFACSLVGWPARHYLTIGQRWPGIRHWQSTWSGATTRARHRTRAARRCSSAVGRSRISHDPCHEPSLRPSLASSAGSAWSREPPAHWRLGNRCWWRDDSQNATTPKSWVSTCACSSRRTCDRRKGWRCVSSSSFRQSKEFLQPWASGHYSRERASQGSLAKQASTTPASHWNWHADSSCSRSAVDQRHTRRTTAPLSLLIHASDKGKALKQLRCQQLQITPNALRHGSAREDPAVNARRLEEVQKREAWKSFASVRRYEKHARLSLIVSKIPPELLGQGLALERDLERLWRRL